MTQANPSRPRRFVHVCGANIGAVEQSIFTPDGAKRRFVSGYSHSTPPNLWGELSSSVGEKVA